MRKLILGMVFVFATGTIMNANSSKKVKPDYCIQLGQNAYQFLVGFKGDHQLAVDTANAITEDCWADTDAIPGYYD
jgi:hypothetical protein